MKFLAALSLGLLGSIPHRLSILQKRDNTALSSFAQEDNSFLEWGAPYVKLELEETDVGFMAHIFEHFGSCYMPDVAVSPYDSIFRYQSGVSTPEYCHTLCEQDVRCKFARHLKEQNVCHFLEYSATASGNTDTNSMVINGRCDDSCFLKDKKFKGQEMGTVQAIDAIHCHNLCIQNELCRLFTFNTETDTCYFYDMNASPVQSPDHVSGPGEKCESASANLDYIPDTKDCDLNENQEFCNASCHMRHVKYVESYAMIETTDAYKCHKACHEDSNCWNWSFYRGNQCHLHNALQSTRSTNHTNSTAGPKTLCGGQEPLLKSLYSVNAFLSNFGTILDVENVSKTEDCEQLCKNRRDCLGYMHRYNNARCQLYDSNAPAPVTTNEYSPFIVSVVDGSTHLKCSQYNQALHSTESYSSGEKLNLVQCIMATRKRSDVVGYLWVNGECHQLASPSGVEPVSDDSKPSGIYGAVGVCHEPQQITECYHDNQSITGVLKRHVDNLGSPEACHEKCKEFPWCIATIWQKDMVRCHLMDTEMTTTRRNNNDMFASRSCDTSCFDKGFNLEGSTILESFRSSSAQACQIFCNAKKACVSFSFDTVANTCELHSITGKLEKKDNIISGPRMFCDAPVNPVPKELLEPADGFKNKTIYGEVIGTSRTTNVANCKAKCDINASCIAYTYSDNNNHCYLKGNFDNLIDSNEDNRDTTYLKYRKYDCYNQGSISSSVNPISIKSFGTLSECNTHCMALENCVGIEYEPLEHACKLFDVAGFHQSTSNGSRYINYAGECF